MGPDAECLPLCHPINKPGTQHTNADGLSRLPFLGFPTEVPLPGDTVCLLESLQAIPLTTKQIKKCVDVDPLLSRVYENILRGW